MGWWTVLPIFLYAAVTAVLLPSSSSSPFLELSFAYLQWNSSSTTPACDNCPAGHDAQLSGAVCSSDSSFWEAGVHKFKDPILVGHKLFYVWIFDLVDFSFGIFLLFHLPCYPLAIYWTFLCFEFDGER